MRIWFLPGFDVLQQVVEASEALPVLRTRLLFWAVRRNKGGASRQRLEQSIGQDGIHISPACPFARDMLWHACPDTRLSVPASDLALYIDPNLRPRRLRSRFIEKNGPVVSPMASYGRAHEYAYQQLKEQDLHDQLLADSNGIRHLHPTEPRVMMASWHAIGNAIPGTLAAMGRSIASSLGHRWGKRPRGAGNSAGSFPRVCPLAARAAPAEGNERTAPTAYTSGHCAGPRLPGSGSQTSGSAAENIMACSGMQAGESGWWARRSLYNRLAGKL